MKRVSEYRRTCNSCGKIWHSLTSREKQLEQEIATHGFLQSSSACAGHYGVTMLSAESQKSCEDLLYDLRRCPNCCSNNYEEEILHYEK